MNASEAEKLLGGYATGTLTKAERSSLFAAALGDQELFNALADEEVLRELLEDPQARAQLIAALNKTSKVVPFWRRPAVMSLAAGLLVAVGGSLVVYRSNISPQRAMEPSQERQAAPKDKAKPAEAAKLGELAGKAKAEPPPSAPASTLAAKQESRRAQPAKELGKDADAAQPVQLPSPKPPVAPASPAPAAVPAEEAAHDKVAESKADELRAPARLQSQPAPAPQAAAGAGALGGNAFARRKEAKKASEAPKTERQDGFAYTAQGLAAGAVGGAPAGGMNLTSEKPASTPTWSTEPMAPGYLRLKVRWSPGGQLYLLHRSPSGAVTLVPGTTTPAESGVQLSTFTCRTGAREALDLYQLPQAVENPAALPERGPVPGFRVRVWPAEKNSP